MTRLSFRALVLVLALSVILLSGATSQPEYLQGTQLLPAFRMTFTLHQMNEYPPPNPNQKDEVVYLTAGSTTYFKSIFRQSPLLPGEPVSFKDREVEWYVVRDPNFNNQYTARVYCRACNPKSYVLVAVNFGPPRPDAVARFNAKLDLPPLPVPRPSSHLPVIPPKTTPVEWFLTSGTTNKFGQTCLVPGGDQGYFAMYAQQGVTSGGVFYKQPYGMVGGGAGAWHQGYGEIVYDKYEIPPNLTPAMFAPPSGYTQITNQKMSGGEIMVKENCAVCHITESGPTTLFVSPPPPKPSGQ